MVACYPVHIVEISIPQQEKKPIKLLLSGKGFYQKAAV